MKSNFPISASIFKHQIVPVVYEIAFYQSVKLELQNFFLFCVSNDISLFFKQNFEYLHKWNLCSNCHWSRHKNVANGS